MEVSMSRYEYKVVFFKTIEAEDELNNLADEGWEVIAMTISPQTNYLFFTLKRPKI
jgi:hypothetical protein